jgi:ATP-dependent DNA helicase RecG
MDLYAVQGIMQRLATARPCDLESQTLEFKSWGRDEKDLSASVSEAAICLANSEGGLVVVGADDKTSGVAAVRPCPYKDLTADWLKMRIKDLTKPPVICNICRLGDLLPSLRGSAAAELFIVEVPKTTRPSGHRTIRGISYIRANTECRPEYLVSGDDYTAEWLESCGTEHLDRRALQRAIESREDHFPSVRSSALRPADHLFDTGLIRMQTEAMEGTDAKYIPSIACLLLLGADETIKSRLPAAETVLVIERPSAAPLTSSNWYNVTSAVQSCLAMIVSELPERLTTVLEDPLRELILNAYLHRCYRTTGPVQVRIAKDEVEIRNPGGLLGDLTPDCLLYSTPVYRNFPLADGARQFGLCEKAGVGLDKVYYKLILEGLDFPIFQVSPNSFAAILRTRRDLSFSRFIREGAGTLGLKLPDLMVLRRLRTHGETTVGDLVRVAQRPSDYLEYMLRDLERKEVVGIVGSRVSLSGATSRALESYDSEGQLDLF